MLLCRRAPVRILLVFVASVLGVQAAPSGLELYQQSARDVEDKRFKSRIWHKHKKNDWLEKSFPLKEWQRHFSALGAKRAPIGAKRAPIAVQNSSLKKRYRTRIKQFSRAAIDPAALHQRWANLQRQAKISTDDAAKGIADKQLYNMALQDTRQYQELGVKLSLREINRYQFRRNRPAAEVPISPAGGR